MHCDHLAAQTTQKCDLDSAVCFDTQGWCQAPIFQTDNSCQNILVLLHLFQKGARHTFHRQIGLHVQTHFLMEYS